MYTNFPIEQRGIPLTGYHYPCPDGVAPRYIVCLIHGIGEHAGRFARVAGYLNERGIAVLSMDLRGHGKSAGKRGHCAPRKDVLGDVDALIEIAKRTYSGLPVVLYGHSMGGNIVLDYRQRGKYRHQLAGYVISAPWIRLTRPVTGVLYQAVKLLAKIAPQMTIGSACAEEDLGNPEFVRPYHDDPLVHSRISMLCAYEGYTVGQALETGTVAGKGSKASKGSKADGTGAAPSAETHTETHADPVEAIPCLLLHGTADKICDIEGSRAFAARQRAKNFHFEELPGYYHEIHNGTPDGKTGEEVIARIGDFIESL